MDTVIHYFTGMSMFLVAIVLAAMWLTSILVSALEGRFIVSILPFFIPPIGIVYISYTILLESKGLDCLSGMNAFKALMNSFKKEDKCILKKY